LARAYQSFIGNGNANLPKVDFTAISHTEIAETKMPFWASSISICARAAFDN
jgi:hypothetical protein